MQKFLASAGVASRRRCEELIAGGRVKVNGRIVDQPGSTVDPRVDEVRVDGKRVSPPARDTLVYIMMHKPAGCLTTARDTHGRKTVLDLIPSNLPGRVFPVGRLDADTSGLLLLTNDGPLAHVLTHPSFGVTKIYLAKVRGQVGRRELEQLRGGILLEDGPTSPALVEVTEVQQESSTLELSIHEGRKRQVRRMCGAVGHPVLELKRTRFGPLELGELAPGSWRYLSAEEIKALGRSKEH
ncbi:MAG: rRNA pseudouridine synthase [Firmicutes bacterium]|nr:rRNA pseudouridine synthase [Bacillota bacterium]